MSLLACPFCREMFQKDEQTNCPLCGMSLVAFEKLPASADAGSLDRKSTRLNSSH